MQISKAYHLASTALRFETLPLLLFSRFQTLLVSWGTDAGVSLPRNCHNGPIFWRRAELPSTKSTSCFFVYFSNMAHRKIGPTFRTLINALTM